MAELMDGKKVAEHISSQVLLEISLLPMVPKIVFIMVGDNAASQTYVRAKGKKCRDLGLLSETIVMPAETTEEELFQKLHSLNRDKDVQGILVQLPLPGHLDKNRVLREIDPLKDVDGLHPESMGRLMQGEPRFVPCTPAGVYEILKFYNVPVEGAKVVVVGRSEIVGKPAALLMLLHNATVTVCHSKTRDLEKVTSEADILIVAMGKPKFIGPQHVKPGAVVIDVGIHRVNDKLVGDVDFEAVAPKAKAITPVPGGVGPMTIAMLMKNLVTAAKLQTARSKS
jgi:methylenetetrahydrofolate dehydrogenase (NADP+)/methenyltetrahydrofolate cyclohydrolase